MKMTVNDTVYDLRFNSYNQLYEGKIKPLKGKEIPTTTVYIAWFDKEKDEVRSVMATSFCSPKDPYDETKGRKVAFGRALNHMFPPYTEEQIAIDSRLRSIDSANKASRDAFWKAYLVSRSTN